METTETLREMSDKIVCRDPGGGPVAHNRPSSIGHPCVRYLVLLRVIGLKPWTADKLRLFATGRVTEEALLLHFARSPAAKEDPGLGLKVGRFSGYVRIEGVEMWGRPDGTVEGVDTRPKVVVEIKALNPYAVEKLHDGDTVEEAFQDDRFYCRYPAQGQFYMAALNEPRMAWFICPRGDHLSFVELRQELNPMAVDLICEKSNEIDRLVRNIHARARENYGDFDEKATPEGERRVELAAAAPAPDWIEQCDGCDFARDCWGSKARPAVEEIDDPELAADLDKMHELKPAHSEYDKIVRRIKRQVDGVTGTKCGRWLIMGKRVERKGYAVEAGSYWKSEFILEE